jgi:hypothetical protein
MSSPLALADATLADCLAHFPQVRLRVTGACMEPRLPEGIAVLLESSDRVRPRWGDVVLVRHAAGSRLHRLVWCPPFTPAWRTQADRSPTCDPAVDRAEILAVAVAIPETQGPRLRSRTVAARGLARAILARLRAILPT